MDGSDLNSPALGTRTDVTGMGGESGESSGGSDDDFDDNQEYEDTGVEDAPTETIDSSEAPTSDAPTGEQAPQLRHHHGRRRSWPLPPPLGCPCPFQSTARLYRVMGDAAYDRRHRNQVRG